jgi:hypothetical protein
MDLLWCVRRLPAPVVSQLKAHPNKAFVTGGFIRARIARLVRGVDIRVHSIPGLDGELKLAKVLTGLLREVDPNTDPDHIAHLPAEKGMDVVAEEDPDAPADT